MTAIGIVVLAAGVSLIWGGITDRAILPEIRAALGNKNPGTKGPAGGMPKTLATKPGEPYGPTRDTSAVGPAGPLGPQGPNGPVG